MVTACLLADDSVTPKLAMVKFDGTSCAFAQDVGDWPAKTETQNSKLVTTQPLVFANFMKATPQEYLGNHAVPVITSRLGKS